ncbi:MAG: DUF433 domain-containing protein [Planctomycetota bacterium]
MDWKEHIDRDPNVCVGKPKFIGTRLTVEFVLERLADGADPQQLIDEYQDLTAERLHAALAYAASAIRDDKLVAVG